MEKHNLMLRALRKSIFWIIIITIDIITFVYDRFFFYTYANSLTIAFPVSLIHALTALKKKNLKNKEQTYKHIYQ